MTIKIEALRSAMETLLKAIAKTGGYQNDIGDVSLEFVYDESTQYPALFVITPETDFDEGCDQSAVAMEKVFIYGLIKDETTPQKSLNNLRSDIIRAISTDLTLGGLAAYLSLKKARNAGDIFNEAGYAPGFKPPHACLCVEYDLQHQIDMRNGS